MSRVKNKKLSTGVQNFALSGVIIAPHIIEEKKQDKELKKEKRKNEFPAFEAGKGSTPETTHIFPTFYCGGMKEEKSAIAGVDLYFVENLLCKKKVRQKWITL